MLKHSAALAKRHELRIFRVDQRDRSLAHMRHFETSIERQRVDSRGSDAQHLAAGDHPVDFQMGSSHVDRDDGREEPRQPGNGQPTGLRSGRRARMSCRPNTTGGRAGQLEHLLRVGVFGQRETHACRAVPVVG